LEYLVKIKSDIQHNYLFFADNGCGEHFGLEVANGIICTSKISVYYPISNEYKIVAQDLYTWAIEWYTGRLSV
jgi:hypothetical protein